VLYLSSVRGYIAGWMPTNRSILGRVLYRFTWSVKHETLRV